MSVEDESVSPAPGGWGASRGRISRPRGWGWVVPLVFVLAGTLFAASALTARGTDLRAGRRTDLTDLVRAQEQKVRVADTSVVALQSEVQALTSSVSGDEALVAANAEADSLAGPAGLTAVRGTAVTVVLDDAPRSAAAAPDDVTTPEGVTPDDLVVHQQDVQAVVNALWAGGAEAMQLMDQRVISTSAVRCVGNTLVLQGRVYSPPFRVTAIGDPAALRQALDASPGVRTYRQFVDVVGLGYSVSSQKEATLPPYRGSLRLSAPAAIATGAAR